VEIMLDLFWLIPGRIWWNGGATITLFMSNIGRPFW